MIWKQIQAKDFLSWGELDLSLQIQKPTLILGENLDNAGASSNGAGKSSVFDAILWALFGKTLRGLSGDDVIRYGQKEARAEISWDDYVVIRTRRPEETELVLKQGKKSLSGTLPTLTQKRIELALGMDYESFVAATVFGQDVTRWATYTDKGRKGILERLCGTDQLERILKEVRGSRQASGLSVGLAQNSIQALEHEGQKAELRLVEIQAEEDQWRERLTQRSDLLAKDLEQATHQQQKLKEDAVAVQERINSLEASAKSVEKQIRDRLEWEAEEKSRLQRLEDTERAIKVLDEEQAALGFWSLCDPCPTCERPLDDPSLLVANRNNQKDIDRIEQERAELEARAQKQRVARPEVAKPPEDALEPYREAQKQMAEIREESHRAEIRIQEIIRETESLIGQEGQFQAARAEIQKAQQEREGKIQVHKQDLDTHHRDDVCLGWLERAFGPQGIRSYLLDAALPRFEAWTNATLEEIGPNLRVKLSAQSTTKSGETREKLDCSVTMDGQVTAYDNLSAGERQRIDVAFALALQSLAGERVNVGLALFDEIFERMDPEGCERISKLLTRRFYGQGCWVITHNDALKVFFREAILVQKAGGVSSLGGRGQRDSANKELVGRSVERSRS